MTPRRRRPALGLLSAVGCAACFILGACDLLDPEVVVKNDLQGPVLIDAASFNGCRWPQVLAPGDATPPCRSLLGEDRVHFAKLDLRSLYEAAAGEGGAGAIAAPTWFNYRTITTTDVDYGGFYSLAVRPDDIEQDFEVPGPYGH
jgi:hypothetical protein